MPEQEDSERFYEAMPAPPSESQAQASGANFPPPPPGPDNTYKKALLKGDINIKKLGEHNYQEWSQIMELYLLAKVFFDKADGSVSCLDMTLRLNDHEAWRFDDTQTRRWIYANGANKRH